MLFTIGTRVRLRYSRESGVVSQILGHGMVEVVLDRDSDGIPVAEEDLLPAVQNEPNSSPAYGDLATRGPSQAITGMGLLLAYLSTPEPHQYLEVLVNDSQDQLLFTFVRYSKYHPPKNRHGKLAPGEIYPLSDFFLDQLNDQLNCEVKCWRKTGNGSEFLAAKTVRLRPKTFFAQHMAIPLAGQEAPAFVVASPESGPKPAGEDLRTYTQERLSELPTGESAYTQVELDLWEVASFHPVVDLHIEKLADDPSGMTVQEILQLQLDTFYAFIQKAYQLGLERVFVIHGVGKGRLRREIARRLEELSFVCAYKNEYHPSYGFGATEILFC